MSKEPTQKAAAVSKPKSIFSLLLQYRAMIIGLIVLGFLSNGLTLFLPKLIASIINAFTDGSGNLQTLNIEFGLLSLGVLVFTAVQTVLQTIASERVARDIRFSLVDKISHQQYRFIDEKNPSRLLTNVTSDIDSIKMFVAQAVVSLVSSAVIILGVAAILLYTNWRLALAVLTIIPIIAVTFFVIFQQVRKLFLQSREVIDELNRVINESIIGAALIRVLHSERSEHAKFSAANARSRAIGLSILQLFSFLIPIIIFVSSMGTLIVVALGGYFVTESSMSLGSFVAFNSYIAILIFPILVIGFISNIIAQANASYSRIREVLEAPDMKDDGTHTEALSGAIEVQGVSVTYGERSALKNVSFSIMPKTKTAIIGPTGAGKTQLLNVMAGLTVPQEGSVTFDGRPIGDYVSTSFYPQIGLVFQDSILFNTTLRENIAFSTAVTDVALEKAVQTAELSDFVATLPNGLDTVVSERGTTLSGGQKQRVMLARALALTPTILFLDDFTARVDARTERQILENIERNYPNLTLISITQKIAPIENYDQIVLLMEGEMLARGTHAELLESSLDYQQIYNSQRSTNAYELRT